ncbi:hypothetical protein ACU4GR_11330 [Methylobacterium oryzae CBMB20]
MVVNDTSVPSRPRERIFGGPAPDGPLPGHLLVLLSRLHRAEAAPKDGETTARLRPSARPAGPAARPLAALAAGGRPL